MGKLLEINNLKTSFKIQGDYYAAVDGISLDIDKNEVFAVVGESGSGKSAMALSISRSGLSGNSGIDIYIPP